MRRARAVAAPQGQLASRVPLAHLLRSRDGGVAWIGSTVTLAGWARTMRLQEKDTLAFIELADGTAQGTVQVVVKNTIANWTEVREGVSVGASVMAVGEIIKSPAKGQVIELQAHAVTVLGRCPTDYPIAKSRQALTLEYLRTVQHLRPRTNTFSAVARLRNCLAHATHEFFQTRGFFYFNAPLITASDCEGAGEMFCVTTLLADKGKPIAPKMAKDLKTVDYALDFFKRPAFLTVSGQLEAETHACALSNVYTFGPTFRAEDSDTPRHLAEFWMIEPEVAFADLAENMALAEAFIKHVMRAALERCPAEMQFFEESEQRLLKDSKSTLDKVSVPHRVALYGAVCLTLCRRRGRARHCVSASAWWRRSRSRGSRTRRRWSCARRPWPTGTSSRSRAPSGATTSTRSTSATSPRRSTSGR